METFTPGDVARASPVPGKRVQKKAVAGATLGTIVEFADWIICATFAVILSRRFFLAADETVSLLSAFSVFAAGFVMRPIGGALLGAYADRHGRKNSLALPVAMMAGSSLVIAVCPGYETIGMAAPIILVVAWLAQGFAAGGALGSSSTFLIELAAPSRRGFAGSWQHLAVNAGVLEAAAVGAVPTFLFDPVSMEKWGWRVGFAVTGLLGLVLPWARLAPIETELFKTTVENEQRGGHPSVAIFCDHHRPALLVVGIATAGNLCVYPWLIIFLTLAHPQSGLSVLDGLNASSISIVVSLVAIPFIGERFDRAGRKPVLIAFVSRVGAVRLARLAPPRQGLLERHDCRADRGVAIVRLRRDPCVGHGRVVSGVGARNGRGPAVRPIRRPGRRHAALHRDHAGGRESVAVLMDLPRGRVCRRGGDLARMPETRARPLY